MAYECESMELRSTFRSRMIRTGREVGVPADDAGRALDEKRLSRELRMWSRNLRSSFPVEKRSI